MDQIDRKLLMLLQENARMPLKAIAAQVFLSAPAVSARIEKLEAQGLIVGYHAEIDHRRIGYPITAYISLELPAQQKPTFYPFIASCPQVIECNCVTGVYSMLIKAAFPDTEELDDFIGELSRFGNTSTQIVFSTPVPHRNVCLQTETEKQPS
ncbi:MAG: Lrp/AsnC family transcriptional regulator [Oscillospiraceae bacterium]|nr:Lrp/AsnC family transcriptional regulator [Oscillospiraceae bacterium]